MYAVTPAHKQSTPVDINVPRFNQAIVAVLTATAFVIQQPLLVALTFVILSFSAIGGPKIAPLTQLYVRVVRPRFQPLGPGEFEPSGPPRFAQLVGTLFLATSTVALWSGLEVIGWSLSIIVTALAALAASTRICVGCILYERTIGR